MQTQACIHGIGGVLFDVGGTLLRADPSVPELFATVARRRGHDITVRDTEPAMALVDEFYQSEYLRDGDFWCSHPRSVQLWLDMYGIMARAVGVGGDAAGIAHDLYAEYLHPENWSFFPDVLNTLKGLKRSGLKLGVVSNWDATLESLLRGLEVLPYFDTVISSAAVGYRKPGSVIFEMALEELQLDARATVHVGDLPEADGAGAESAGITPVIIDRAGKHPECPYRTVQSLTELLDIVNAD